MVWDDGMKLKTLKDIEKNWDKGTFYEGHNVENPWAKILRKEAINWIKAINKTNFNYMKYQIVSTNIRNDIHAAILKDATKISLIKWIKQFFNITSEEEFK